MAIQARKGIRGRLPSGGVAALFALFASGPVAAEVPQGPASASELGKRVPVKLAPGQTLVTYSGFQVWNDGSSRLFVNLTSETAVEPSLQGKKAEYLLRGAKIVVKNNKNPLLTRHFASVVTDIRLVPEGRDKTKHRRGRKAESDPTDVRLIVDMREAVKPEHRLVKNSDGTATFVVDFPKPSSPPPPEPDPVPPPVRGAPQPPG